MPAPLLLRPPAALCLKSGLRVRDGRCCEWAHAASLAGDAQPDDRRSPWSGGLPAAPQSSSSM